MRTILSLFLIAGFFTATEAQRYRNPQQYLREFSNEHRKINIKNQLYLEANLKGEDERRVEKYRELVTEQLKESRRDLERVGTYEDYEILKREYLDGLTLFIDAYEKDYGKVATLRDSAYESYKNLMAYYDALTEAENKMLEANYKLEKAEDHFAKSYYVEVRRDEEVQEKYDRLDEVTVYVRDMSKALFRVEQHVQRLLTAVENDDMDTLGFMLTDMRNAIRESQKSISDYENFEGEDDLYEEVRYYLEEVTDEINETLRPAVDVLQNRFADVDDVEDARRDIERFKSRHKDRMEDFHEAKMEVIEEYLPED